MIELLQRIEEARTSMYECAEQYGFTAPQVLEQSQKLDGLLNAYNSMVSGCFPAIPRLPEKY